MPSCCVVSSEIEIKEKEVRFLKIGVLTGGLFRKSTEPH
jgi:hypothetical protein